MQGDHGEMETDRIPHLNYTVVRKLPNKPISHYVNLLLFSGPVNDKLNIFGLFRDKHIALYIVWH